MTLLPLLGGEIPLKFRATHRKRQRRRIKKGIHRVTLGVTIIFLILVVVFYFGGMEEGPGQPQIKSSSSSLGTSLGDMNEEKKRTMMMTTKAAEIFKKSNGTDLANDKNRTERSEEATEAVMVVNLIKQDKLAKE